MNISQNKLSRSLGELTSFVKTSHGIEAETSYGSFRLMVYDARTIRVHVTIAGAYRQHSYAVVAAPAGEFSLEERDAELILSTSKMQLVITRAPVRFYFHDLDGNVINEDDTAFGTSWIGDQVTTYKKLQEGERFIGLGEKTGPLDRRGAGYEHWNTDHYAYREGSDPLYCSMPFYIGIHHGQVYGIYLDNSHKTHFNFGASNDRFSSFSADHGDMDYYFFYDDSVSGVLEAYTQLTGRTPLPPLWSIGYQQCRYSYYPDKEVLSLARNFQEKKIPADAIVLDIHYMDKFKIFTWDKEHFKDPKGMIKELRKQGFHVVVMCDPGIKIEEGYEPYESGKAQDIFVKYPDGSYYSGEVWPGWCHFPDFTHPAARAWWREHLEIYADMDIEGYWNDMNEIATWGNTLPELMEFEFDGNKTTAREARNVYGMQMARSTYEGARELLKGKRPFSLTRSAFSGIQRYSAVWTGDNMADDDHMMLGIRLVNSMGLTGVAFTGYDVGGFVGNASEHLFARWVQVGAFSPFFRGHSMVNSRDSEPWSYGEEVEEISRNFITLRYKLMPYLYSCFYETALTGIPVARSLAIDYPHASWVYDKNFQHQYLFGPSILVIPVKSDERFTKLYLPKGEWYDLFTDRVHPGDREVLVESTIETLPLYVKASSIIPMAPAVQENTKNLGDLLEIHVYKGEDDHEFTYYEDDGETFDYEKDVYHRRQLRYIPGKSTLEISAAEGSFKSRFNTLKICFHGFGSMRPMLNQKEQTLEFEDYRYIAPISNFDPVGVPGGDFKLENLPYLLLDYSDGPMIVQW